MRRGLLGVAALVLLVGTMALVPATSAETGERVKRDRDCADFSSQAAAQNYYNGQVGDPDGLDADGDGVACETNPCPCIGAGGGGGGAGGGGGGGAPLPPPPPPPPPDPTVTKELCGKFVGIPNTRVCLEATTKGGKLKQVEDFRFKRLPARCDDGSKRLVSGKRAKIDGDGSKFRSRRLKIKGDFSAIDAKVAGEVKGESKKAGGEVRVRFRSSSGAACDSRDRKWKVG